MKLMVNGTAVEVDDRHAGTPLLWVLRDVLGLSGTKFGCGAGYCQPGQTLAAIALLSATPEPDDAAIDRAMSCSSQW